MRRPWYELTAAEQTAIETECQTAWHRVQRVEGEALEALDARRLAVVGRVLARAGIDPRKRAPEKVGEASKRSASTERTRRARLKTAGTKKGQA